MGFYLKKTDETSWDYPGGDQQEADDGFNDEDYRFVFIFHICSFISNQKNKI
jgi:hypothetical protein